VNPSLGRDRFTLRSFAAALGLVLLLASPRAGALEGRARAALAGEVPVWVGQRVIVHVDLISDGFMFSDQRFRLPEVSGGLLMRDASSALYLSEEIGGETWQVQRYSFSLFPQREGEITIPPIPVWFGVSSGYGQEVTSFELVTEPLRVRARVPPGVKDPTGLITAEDVEVEVSWQPEIEGLLVGDAFTRTVRRRAANVSGMAFVPLPVPEIEGLAVYPKPPEVRDTSERGSLVGERSESVAFVAQRPGSFEIPELVVSWWDPSAERLEERRFEERKLEVAPNPALGPSTMVGYTIDRQVREHPIRTSALAVAAAGLLFWAWRKHKRLIDRWREWRASRRESEGAYFRRLQRRCREGKPAAVYDALSAWLQRSGAVPAPVTLTAFARTWPDQALERELDALQQALLTPGVQWSGSNLARMLTARRKAMKQRDPSGRDSLPPLNPAVY
jgi:hypothetical protein